MSTERRIKALKLRQKSLIASLNLITVFVEDFDEATQADEVPVRLESLTQLWSDYNRNQNELETLDEAAIDVHLKERTLLESSYYKVKGFLLAHNKSPMNQTLQSPSHLTPQVPPSASHVRLPDVKLPIFDGKLENWMNFHDLYLSLVHSSADLSNIQKFYYLRSSLSDSALQLIQTIPISAVNYPVAWNLLLEHFQNPARLKQTYVDAIFEFPSLKKESASELHSLVEKFEANVKVLQQLGERIEHWDILLIRLLSTRLDPTTRRDWEEFATTKTAVTFKDLTGFVQRRVTVLQSLQPKIIDTQSSIPPKKPAQRSVSSYGATQLNYRKCVICSDHHPLYMCESFSNLSQEEKESEVRRHQLCRNCLRKGHQSKNCSSSSNCRKCRGRHHTQLCSIDPAVSSDSTPSSSHSTATSETPSTSTLPSLSASATFSESVSCASGGCTQKTVLLATALIDIIDDEGNKHTARALLDSGSECCFVAEQFAQRIKARRKKINMPISGIGQSSTYAKTKFVSRILSRVGEYSTNIEFIVLPKVTVNIPSTSIDTSYWDMPPGIKLADPAFDCTSPIDVVIGAEVFFEVFRVPGRIPLGHNLPDLVNSVFGWVVCGKSDINRSSPIVANFAIIARPESNPTIKLSYLGQQTSSRPSQTETGTRNNVESPPSPGGNVHGKLINQSGKLIQAQQAQTLHRSQHPKLISHSGNMDPRISSAPIKSPLDEENAHHLLPKESLFKTSHLQIEKSESAHRTIQSSTLPLPPIHANSFTNRNDTQLQQAALKCIEQDNIIRQIQPSFTGARVGTSQQQQHRQCLHPKSSPPANKSTAKASNTRNDHTKSSMNSKSSSFSRVAHLSPCQQHNRSENCTPNFVNKAIAERILER